MQWPETGHINEVPDIHATKMLARHPDVYELVEKLATDEVAEATEESDLAEAHALRQLVETMDKVQLAEFAQAKFGAKLDGRLAIGKARSTVIDMIDMYGVP